MSRLHQAIFAFGLMKNYGPVHLALLAASIPFYIPSRTHAPQSGRESRSFVSSISSNGRRDPLSPPAKNKHRLCRSDLPCQSVEISGNCTREYLITCCITTADLTNPSSLLSHGTHVSNRPATMSWCTPARPFSTRAMAALWMMVSVGNSMGTSYCRRTNVHTKLLRWCTKNVEEDIIPLQRTFPRSFKSSLSLPTASKNLLSNSLAWLGHREP